MMSVPPITPGEARFDSASAATFVPTMDFHVTAPRTGYMIDAPSIAAAEASLVQGSTCTPSSPISGLAWTMTSIRCETGAPW